jgi:hypothetical protein
VFPINPEDEAIRDTRRRDANLGAALRHVQHHAFNIASRPAKSCATCSRASLDRGPAADPRSFTRTTLLDADNPLVQTAGNPRHASGGDLDVSWHLSDHETLLLDGVRGLDDKSSHLRDGSTDRSKCLAEDRIIYDAAKGALYYDKDGAGGSAQVQFAKIDKHLKLTAFDFQIV